MVSGTACGLLLLFGGLSVALTMDTFPQHTVVVFGAVLLLVSLLPTHKSLIVVVPTVSLCTHTCGIGASCSSATLP